jgi:hypothetical protein
MDISGRLRKQLEQASPGSADQVAMVLEWTSTGRFTAS